MRASLLLALCLLGCERPRRATPEAPRPALIEAPDVPATVEEEAPPVAPAMTPATDAEMRAFARGVEGLAWRLFARLAARPGNRVFSPAATAVALAMTASLDRGPSAAEARRALAPDLDEPALDRAAGTALRTWQREVNEASGLLAVQRVFIDRAVRLEDAASVRLRDVYGAPVGVVDTGGPEGARRRIDGFLRARTRGAVPDAVPDYAIVADAPVTVGSAAFGRFACSGEVTSIDFLVGGVAPTATRAARCSGEVRSARGEGFTLWRVPSSDGAYALDMVLPDPSTGVRALEERLDEAAMRAAIDALRPVGSTLTLPTVRTANESPGGSRDSLYSMGFGGLFDPERSRLARVTPGGRWVSELYHRARFELEAEASEAGARPEGSTVDSPFVFALRDARLGMPLVVGHVVDPSR